MRRALNTYDPQPIAIVQSKRSSERNRHRPTELAAVTTRIEGCQNDVPPTDLSPDSGKHDPTDSKPVDFKGNKRVRPDQPAVVLTGIEEASAASQITSTNTTCTCTTITRGRLSSEIPSDRVSAARGDHFRNRMSEMSQRTSSCDSGYTPEQSCKTPGEILEKTTRSHHVTTQVAEELLFSGMDWPESDDNKIARGRSSISISSSESGTVIPRTDIMPVSDQRCNRHSPVNIHVQEPKRRRRSGPETSRLSTNADWTDEKFNEFWKWDPEKENWYRFDEGKNNTIWYKPPPWSTASVVKIVPAV